MIIYEQISPSRISALNRIDMRLFRFVISLGVSTQFIVDLFYFQRREKFWPLHHVLCNFASQHILVHHLHFRRINRHFLEDATLAENDIGTKNLVAQTKVLLQNADMLLVLPDGIVELIVPAASKNLFPVLAVLIPENPAAEIFRLENIDAGYRNHDQVDFSGRPIYLGQINIRQQFVRIAQVLQTGIDQEFTVFSIIKQSIEDAIAACSVVRGPLVSVVSFMFLLLRRASTKSLTQTNNQKKKQYYFQIQQLL